MDIESADHALAASLQPKQQTICPVDLLTSGKHSIPAIICSVRPSAELRGELAKGGGAHAP